MTSVSATLPSVNVAGKPVRFLYYRAPCIILTAHTTELKCTDVPLFLAADVLAGSSQAVKNHSRIHARYAKDGLASRLTFNNVKIEGIHNSSVVWFYNVQGLFKVVFEHLDTAAQRDCLTQLKELWLERCADPTLKETVEVHHLTDGKEDPETAADSISVRGTEMTMQSLDRILELLHSHMSAMLASGQDLLQKLIVLIEFFKHEFLMQDPSGESAAFPYSVLEQYTLLIKNCGIQKLFGNKFDIPCRRNAVLCLLSEWLGSQLHSLSDALHCKVEEFKQRNINCIENLPCPRTLVDLVFPRCMQILLVYWLGEQEEETEEPYAGADHSYSAVRRSHCPNSATPAATPSTSTPDKFPFIQFILEFANNALISGVAHVVYSRLVNSC
ncbi:hypothetical protein LSAT2_006615 [Lamellibrachia satsuma]|nr:hypothetical protein LSAT2_006615 [Lamellibrachia satsuma]